MGYSPVYSSQFIVYNGESTPTEFEVPAGFTAIVRQLTAVVTIAATTIACTIQDSASAPSQYIWLITAAEVGATYSEEGRWVVPEGGFIRIESETVGEQIYVYVGGYLLRNVLT